MAKRPGIREQRRNAFAEAYTNPTSPTHLDPIRSYLTVFPEASYEAAQAGSKRYLDDPRVQEKIAEIAAGVQRVSGITPEEYVRQCLEMEREMIQMARDDVKGAAAAAAKYREMAGKALGMFIIRTEDLTPPERKVAKLTPEMIEEQALALLEAARRAATLNTPLPQAKALVPDTLPEAEYEVVEEEK